MSDSLEEIDRKTSAWLEETFGTPEKPFHVLDAITPVQFKTDYYSMKAAEDLGVSLEEFQEVFYMEDLRDIGKMSLNRKYTEARRAAKESILRVINTFVERVANP